MKLRAPAVAGRFYEGTQAGLKNELSGLVERTAVKEDCLGAVSPHAGYLYSGAVAGKVLSRIRFKDTFLLLGPNHTGIGAPLAIQARGSWRTPLGDAPIDENLARSILKEAGSIKEDDAAHASEHSIEVQLPFLQYMKSDVKFVPIAIAALDIDELKDIGRRLAAAIKDCGEDVVIIASSDMTHYESRESAEEKDGKAIDAILKLDEDALAQAIAEWDISMCGYAPAIIMLSALKGLGASNGKLVDYRTSGDVTGDYSSVVGYAGILIN